MLRYMPARLSVRLCSLPPPVASSAPHCVKAAHGRGKDFRKVRLNFGAGKKVSQGGDEESKGGP